MQAPGFDLSLLGKPSEGSLRDATASSQCETSERPSQYDAYTSAATVRLVMWSWVSKQRLECVVPRLSQVFYIGVRGL